MEKLLGLYGGTFDPPHNAHLMMAEAFLKQFEGSSLVVMPCLIPPHKQRQGGATAEKRLEMLRLCFGDMAGVSVSNFELKNDRTSYTYLTVQHLMEEYPDSKICLIMGQDNLMIMEKWKEYRFLLENCVLVTTLRGDEPIDDAIEHLRHSYGADIRILNMEKTPLSSTAVREKLEKGEDVGGMIPGRVYEYIKREGLYGQVALLEEIRQYISILSPKRLRHTLGVEEAALMLAANHYPTLDSVTVSAAALLHDCTKELTADEQLDCAAKYGVVFGTLEIESPKLMHAVTGAAVARAVFDLDDEVCSAILYHTTAKDDMKPLEKILYLADFIDKNRADELCMDVRAKYFAFLEENKDTALDATLLYAINRSIVILEQECKKIHPHTIEARNFLKERLADEDNKGRADK